MQRYNPAMLTVLMVLSGWSQQNMAAEGAKQAEITFSVSPIGWVRKEGERTRVVLDKKYQPGLLGLEGFSHVYVFWWFDRNDTPQQRSVLQVHPRGDAKNPLTGVFATRAPVRPNLIALTLCRIVSLRDNVVEIETIDALPDTPVLDLKPYVGGRDVADNPRLPEWARR